MATRTISAAGGNWSDPATWEEGAVPESSDDVVARADGTSGDLVWTHSTTTACKRLDLENYNATLYWNGTLRVGTATTTGDANACRFSSTMSIVYSGTPILILFSYGDRIFTPGGQVLRHVRVEDGTWTQSGSLEASEFTLTKGTYNRNGYTVTLGKFTSIGTQSRQLTDDVPGALIVLTGTGEAWNTSNVNNFFFNLSNTTLQFTGSSPLMRAGNNRTYGTVEFLGTGATTIYQGSTFGTIRAPNGGSITFASDSVTTTVLDEFTVKGTVSNRFLVNFTVTAYLDLTTADISGCEYVDFSSVRLVAEKDFSTIVGGSGDLDGNVNVIFTAPETIYFIRNSSTWENAGNWASTSGGVGGSARVPLVQDSVIADANSLTTNTTVNISGNLPRLLDFSLISYNLELNCTGTITCYGSLRLSPKVTVDHNNNTFQFVGRRAATLLQAGNVFGSFTLNAPGGSLTLEGALTVSSATTFTAGDFYTGDYTTYFNAGGTGGGGNYTHSSDCTVHWGNGPAIHRATAAYNCVMSFGGPSTYGDDHVWTFNRFGSASTLLNSSATFQNVVFDFQGSSGHGVQIQLLTVHGQCSFIARGAAAASVSFSADTGDGGAGLVVHSFGKAPIVDSSQQTMTFRAGHATRSTKWSIPAGETIAFDNITLVRIIAVGDGEFYAGASSTDGGGNTGWVFKTLLQADPAILTPDSTLQASAALIRPQNPATLDAVSDIVPSGVARVVVSPAIMTMESESVVSAIGRKIVVAQPSLVSESMMDAEAIAVMVKAQVAHLISASEMESEAALVRIREQIAHILARAQMLVAEAKAYHFKGVVESHGHIAVERKRVHEAALRTHIHEAQTRERTKVVL